MKKKKVSWAKKNQSKLAIAGGAMALIVAGYILWPDTGSGDPESLGTYQTNITVDQKRLSKDSSYSEQSEYYQQMDQEKKKEDVSKARTQAQTYIAPIELRPVEKPQVVEDDSEAQKNEPTPPPKTIEINPAAKQPQPTQEISKRSYYGATKFKDSDNQDNKVTVAKPDQSESNQAINAINAMLAQNNAAYQAEIESLAKDKSGTKDAKLSLGVVTTDEQKTAMYQIPNSIGEIVKNAIVQAGYVGYGVMISDVSSDAPTPILLTIPTGTLKGAKLIGEFQMPDKRAEGLILSFNTMIWNKKQYKIKAIGVNADNFQSGVATDVDRHIMYRYGSLFLAGAAQGVNQGLQQLTNTKYLTNDGQPVSVGQAINSEQIALMGASNIGNVFVPILTNNFDTPNTVTITSGTGIGILFLEPVIEGSGK